MKVVYIAHPLNADTRHGIEANRRNASEWVAWAAAEGVAPVATWITLSGQWEETDANRKLGLEIDCALISRCDEVWLVGSRVSKGMQIEAEHARRAGIPVLDLTVRGGLPPRSAEQVRELKRRFASHDMGEANGR